MDGQECRSSSKVIGFHLLPDELLRIIIFRLALPQLIRLKSVSKSLANVISDPKFISDYNSESKFANWLFLYTKRWGRDGALHGFTDRSDRWFNIPVADLLSPAVRRNDDLYLLASSGNICLFASNTSKEVISVNLVTKTVRKVPPSPLGPRSTSLWRRSGIKLVAESDHFWFLFAELSENRPVLFKYHSVTDKWQSIEAEEANGSLPRGTEKQGQVIFLSVFTGLRESMLLAVGYKSDEPPVILRPRFDLVGHVDRQSTVGLNWGMTIDRLHVYGNGITMVIKSMSLHPGIAACHPSYSIPPRILTDIELWGLSPNGRNWNLISKNPSILMEKIKKPYGAIMGCVEERNGTIRMLLMSNLEGLWDIKWLSYDLGKDHWKWITVPICNMKGANMSGIAFSSGLTLS